MILTDSRIMSRLEELVDVEKSSGVTYADLEKQVNPNTIDLTIDATFKRPNAIKHSVVYGFSCPEEREIYNLTYWKDCDADNGYIVMKPGDIILANSREYLTMPNDVCGQLFTKSTMGRMFINHMMAGVIDAGFHGKVTYELHNAGVHTIRIPVGARVVQMMCFGLEVAPLRPYGSAERNSRYQNAETVECAKWTVNK